MATLDNSMKYQPYLKVSSAQKAIVARYAANPGIIDAISHSARILLFILP